MFSFIDIGFRFWMSYSWCKTSEAKKAPHQHPLCQQTSYGLFSLAFFYTLLPLSPQSSCSRLKNWSSILVAFFLRNYFLCHSSYSWYGCPKNRDLRHIDFFFFSYALRKLFNCSYILCCLHYGKKSSRAVCPISLLIFEVLLSEIVTTYFLNLF